MKKFEVGDVVVGNANADGVYTITGKGKICTVKEIINDETMSVIALNEGSKHIYYVYKDYFDLFMNDSRRYLKFGDIITLRNGERYVYADDYLYGEENLHRFDSNYFDDVFNRDLKCYKIFKKEDHNNFDIQTIEREGKLIYKRCEENIVEMTVEEVSEKLGYEVKIVKSRKD